MKVDIIKFDHFGRGLGKIDDKVIFVNKALPNEIVDVSIKKEKKNYLEGEIDRIIQKNSHRIDSICPFYNQCGGCNFLHADEEIEKEFKITKAKELLGKVDNFYETKGLNYRNKVLLHVKENKIGLFSENTNDLINIDYCYLLDDNINKVIKDLNRIDLSKYQIKTIIIKSNQDKILMNIDSKVDNDFIDKFSYIDTIVIKNKIVKGNGFIEEKINNKVFKITSNAFFQVNKTGLENIYKIIKDFLKDKKINIALDLYSGTSLWGVLISDYARSIISIEINKEACLNAKSNIQKNGIKNIKIINDDVKNYIDKLSNIDLVIIDPPRSGLDKKTRDYLKKIGSKYIVYVSCDMMSLRRDLNELKEEYDILSVNLVDMFKRTYHVESVCLLCRKNVDK